MSHGRAMTTDSSAHAHRPLLDIAGVAEYLGTSERHIRRLVSERRIPHVKLGGLVRFNLDTIDAWLVDNERRPGGDAPPKLTLVPVRSKTRRRSTQTAPEPPTTTQLQLGD